MSRRECQPPRRAVTQPPRRAVTRQRSTVGSMRRRESWRRSRRSCRDITENLHCPCFCILIKVTAMILYVEASYDIWSNNWVRLVGLWLIVCVCVICNFWVLWFTWMPIILCHKFLYQLSSSLFCFLFIYFFCLFLFIIYYYYYYFDSHIYEMIMGHPKFHLWTR